MATEKMVRICGPKLTIKGEQSLSIKLKIILKHHQYLRVIRKLENINAMGISQITKIYFRIYLLTPLRHYDLAERDRVYFQSLLVFIIKFILTFDINDSLYHCSYEYFDKNTPKIKTKTNKNCLRLTIVTKIESVINIVIIHQIRSMSEIQEYCFPPKICFI